MSTTTSPNMGLTVPGVGSEVGPDWATELNADLSILDSHNHSSGQGVAIQPNGMNINANLPFNSNNATLLRSARFVSQVNPITNTSPDVGCVYVSGNELYYNDATGGNQVQITTNGSVNSGAGSITGLPSGTASAAFAAATYTWNSATNTRATMDMGTIIVRNTTVNGKGVTIAAPTALANNYSLSLPSASAGFVGSLLTSDTSGNITYTLVDGTTISWLAGVLAVGTIQTANIAAGAVTKPKQAAVGQIVSASCGNVLTSSSTPSAATNLSVTIVSTGRPVMVIIQPDGTAFNIGSSIQNTGANSTQIGILRDATSIACWNNSYDSPGGWKVGASFSFIDVVAAASHVYTVLIATSGGIGSINNYVLMAYEL